MNEQEYPQPTLKLPRDAFEDGYSVEIDGKFFTESQWETVKLYAEGLHRAKMQEEDEKGPASMQDMVRHFHTSMQLPAPELPQPLPPERVAVRVELIREEFEDELIPALLTSDLVESADACIDLLYVVLGLLVEMGVRAYPLFAEVQRSNMSKFDEEGKPIIAGPNDPDGIFEGRVKKGPNYFKPELAKLLREQGWQG